MGELCLFSKTVLHVAGVLCLFSKTVFSVAGVFCLGSGGVKPFEADVATLESHLRNVFTEPRPVMSVHNTQAQTYMHNYFQDLVDRYPDITYRQQMFTVSQVSGREVGYGISAYE